MGINCLNYKNQAAIDEAIRVHNRDLGEELYQEGTNVCSHCMGHPIFGTHRICYKPRLVIKVYGNSYAIYDSQLDEFIKSKEGVVLTRDTIPSAKRLMAGIERQLPCV